MFLVVFSVFVGLVVSVGQRKEDRVAMFSLGFFPTFIIYGIIIVGVVGYVQS